MRDRFRDIGVCLVGISPQLPEYSKSVAEDHALTFPILSDCENRVSRAFGLLFQIPEAMREVQKEMGLDLEVFNGEDSWTLPIPARYLVTRDRVIRHAALSDENIVEEEPEETLKVAREILEGEPD